MILRDKYMEKIAATRWKEVFEALGPNARRRLVDTGVNNWETRIDGIERGSEALRKRWVPNKPILRSVEDIPEASRTVQKSLEPVRVPVSDIQYSIKNLTKDHSSFNNNVTVGSVDSPTTGYIVPGALTQRAHKDMAPYTIDPWDKYSTGNRSAEQRYLDAVLTRHEVDESRVAMKHLLDRAYIKLSRDGGSKVLVKDPTGTTNRGASSNHAGVEVLHRESTLVSTGPDVVRDIYLKARKQSGEIDTFMPNYGNTGRINKKEIKTKDKEMINTFYTKLDGELQKLRDDGMGAYRMNAIPLS